MSKKNASKSVTVAAADKAPRVKKEKLVAPEVVIETPVVVANEVYASQENADDKANPEIVVTSTKRTIEKDRPEQNGVKQPSIGGMCRAVWDFCTAAGMPTAADVKAQAVIEKWNANNAMIEYYQWRKFNGIRGRQAKIVAPEAAPAAE